jgi:hypothetical protein
MKGEALQTRDLIAANYLQQLQELASEISVAMGAIAANEMPEFQESISKQEILCSSLETMANTVSEWLSAPAPPAPPERPCVETAVEQKIRTASHAIRELNLQYAALLKHSGRSISLLAALCRSHTGQFQEARGARSKHQTWSCEM